VGRSVRSTRRQCGADPDVLLEPLALGGREVVGPEAFRADYRLATQTSAAGVGRESLIDGEPSTFSSVSTAAADQKPSRDHVTDPGEER
jgi:hypothetical protein